MSRRETVREAVIRHVDWLASLETTARSSGIAAATIADEIGHLRRSLQLVVRPEEPGRKHS